MKRYDLIVVGAGPAGLSAAIEAANSGMKVVVYDENQRPGGQLFKQIHKFFGSEEHKAKVRGFNIGKQLLEESKEAGVEVHLNAQVSGIHDNKVVSIVENEEIKFVKAGNIIIATGASENMIPFDGWTLPGVIGAGAAQTMVNLHRVLPGKRVLMVGSGNVGLVVSYQLLQAGIEVAAIIDAAPQIGGYGVHAAKIARTGVPVYLSHTIVKAVGDDKVEKAIISKVDELFHPIAGTEKEIEVDTICVAVGLTPMSKLAQMAGCKMIDRGGLVPECDNCGETSIPGIFTAGDASGIEEASSAMIEGRIAGAAVCKRDGYITEEEFEEKTAVFNHSLQQLRQGLFCIENRRKKITETEEGILLSQSLLTRGYLEDEEVMKFPGVVKKKGWHPVIECTQNIPCNPCQTACRFHCIKVGEKITSLPVVDMESECKNCGLCVASCSGQAIFLVNEDYDDTSAAITLPYEFLPFPVVGEQGKAMGRSGAYVCDAQVLEVRKAASFDHTNLLTIKVPKEMAMRARFYRR
ncbi:MAG: FAD-dependent oxidoreductase [Lachnospiraceae bacterium]|nr:FAD-dependent oxidoreductase [Lachnospiraceae bacterium]